MRPETRLRGVLFDLDDTLVDSTAADGSVWENVVALLRRDLPDIDEVEARARYVDAAERHYREFLDGRVDFVTFRRRRLGEAIEPWGGVGDELFDAYMREKDRIPDVVTPFPDALAILRALRDLQIRVGVLTNGPGAVQRRKLAASGLEPELDAIAISGELGVAKPDPKAFAMALEQLGTTAEETAMVGDSLENDVVGGLAAGLAAVIWLPGSQTGEHPPGAHLARELAEVPRLLGLVA